MEKTVLTKKLTCLLRHSAALTSVLVALATPGPALATPDPALATSGPALATPDPASAPSGPALANSEADRSDDPDIREFAVRMQQDYGFDSEALLRQLAAIEPNAAVLQAVMPAATAERKSWVRYRARFLTPQRIRGGVKFWQTHRKALRLAEQQFGVPAEIIVAIIGVETEYGRNTGRFSALQALTTLAFYYPPRSGFFREELAQLLVYARENKLAVEDIKSSYAGALGIPQFMPGSLRRYAVDFDRDGRIDLGGSEADAIGSVAAFMAAHGWVNQAPIAERAHIDADSPPPALIDAGIRPTFIRQQLEEMGVSAGTIPGEARVALIDLVSPEGPTEYWWGFENFYVISRYNRSSSYAMAVFHLSQAIVEARKDVRRRQR